MQRYEPCEESYVFLGEVLETMVEDDNGNWVKYSDVLKVIEALQKKITKLETRAYYKKKSIELKYELLETMNIYNLITNYYPVSFEDIERACREQDGPCPEEISTILAVLTTKGYISSDRNGNLIPIKEETNEPNRRPDI